MSTEFVELTPKYFLDKTWEILEPIQSQPGKVLGLGFSPEEEEWRKWIESTRIEVAGVAETTKISSEKKYDYFKSELGLNIILPRGSIEKLRFKITLKGDDEISDEVVAIDGFPKDVIEEKEIIGGKIKVGITKALKFIPVVGNLLPDFLEIELNPWEFKLGSLKKVNIDFSGGLTFQPEWYFKEDGIKNDLRVALTIKKLKTIMNIKGEVIAAWIYDPGIFKKARVGTEAKTIRIY
ncbi:MAG: hypothetical protein H3Z52_13905 [archaeon]|nr:hypothetical protein [archaeon]